MPKATVSGGGSPRGLEAALVTSELVRGDGVLIPAGIVDPNPMPADFGWIAWTADPANCNGTSALTNNTITLCAVYLRNPALVTNIIGNVTTGGGTLTSGQNFAGLYDGSGAQVGVSADQTTPWGSTGVKVMPLTTPYNAPSGKYWIALLSNGTTPPTFRVSAAAAVLANATLSGAQMRCATNGTGTTLPASVTLASNSGTNAIPVALMLS